MHYTGYTGQYSYVLVLVLVQYTESTTNHELSTNSTEDTVAIEIERERDHQADRGRQTHK